MPAKHGDEKDVEIVVFFPQLQMRISAASRAGDIVFRAHFLAGVIDAKDTDEEHEWRPLNEKQCLNVLRLA